MSGAAVGGALLATVTTAPSSFFTPDQRHTFTVKKLVPKHLVLCRPGGDEQTSFPKIHQNPRGGRVKSHFCCRAFG